VSEKALSIREDIARLEQELSEAEDRLPGEIRAEYDRVVGARGEDGLAVVEEGVCGGCYHQIRANQMNELYMGRTVFCHACGRLLYLPEGVGPVRSGSHG